MRVHAVCAPGTGCWLDGAADHDSITCPVCTPR